MKKIGIIGSGSFGLSLAMMLVDCGNDVTVWNYDKKAIDNLIATRQDERYLKGIKVSEPVKFTTDKESIIKDKDIIVIAVPSHAVRVCLDWIKDYIDDSQVVVNVAKGFDNTKDIRLSQTIEEILPNTKYAVLSGPTHAEEIAKKMQTAFVVASNDLPTRKIIQYAFSNQYVRLYTSDDIIGVELGGALKNVIAIGIGILEGAGFGDNAKAAIMTRGNAEITKLGVAMGASRITFSGLTGMGDLIVTCGSMHSRNRRAGMLLGKGVKMDDVLKEIGMVVEGATTAKSAYKLARKFNVETPIMDEVYKIIFEDKNIEESLIDLMSRGNKDEFLIP